MNLCVGAVSKRIVEEAASLGVFQIVASRQQVDIGNGYSGFNQKTFVNTIHKLSSGITKVVRDHGGPLQNKWKEDDGIESFDEDINQGFDILHLDVSKLSKHYQQEILLNLAKKYSPKVDIEIGGEHNSWASNHILLDTLLCANIIPEWIVMTTGAHVWADRQIGNLLDKEILIARKKFIESLDIKVKAHNFDYIHRTPTILNCVDAYNLAPELAEVEIIAILSMLSSNKANDFLNVSYDSKTWEKWFAKKEGTWFERAICGARYILQTYPFNFSSSDEDFIRKQIQNAIISG